MSFLKQTKCSVNTVNFHYRYTLIVGFPIYLAGIREISTLTEFSTSEIPPRDQFQMRYGKSVLSEFVKLHDYSGFIDELVQNDYDAESPETIIQFLEDRLVSTGFGNPIDDDGWKRLEMVMGTDEETIPKQGLLGVKNQGLRSLFLLGDYVIVRSNGYRTVLCMQYGALKEKEKEVLTIDSLGTTIEVIYRAQETNGLPLFTIEKEKKLIRDLERTLPLKIGLLSAPERSKIMNKVTVVSARTNTILICRQNVKIESFAPNALKRMISLEIRREVKWQQ